MKSLNQLFEEVLREARFNEYYDPKPYEFDEIISKDSRGNIRRYYVGGVIVLSPQHTPGMLAPMKSDTYTIRTIKAEKDENGKPLLCNCVYFWAKNHETKEIKAIEMRDGYIPIENYEEELKHYNE